MRTINRDLRKIKFNRIETLPLYTIKPGVEVVTWNTEKQAIVTKQTTPLPVVITPVQWALMAHQDRLEENWIEPDEWLL